MIMLTENLVGALLFVVLACADSTIDPLGLNHLLIFSQWFVFFPA